MTRRTDRPEWIHPKKSIVTAIIGGAFLGVMLAQIPGAIVGWLSSKPKTEV